MYHKVISRFLEISREHLIFSIGGQFYHVPYPDIDDTKETLVLFLELLLVEYLNSQDAVLIHFEIKMFVPVWVQGTLGDLCGLCLLAVDGSDGERVRKPEDISLV